MGRALKDLDEFYDEIQTALILHLVEKFAIHPSLVLWDTTSVYFESDYNDSSHINYEGDPFKH